MTTCKDCDSIDLTQTGRCREHYNAYMREYKKARYKRLRAAWIEKLGGVCVDCGTTMDLEFDHEDSFSKKFDVSCFDSYSLAKIAEEMQKCVLRCKKHHLEKSLKEDMGAVKHGGGVSGKKNCSCSLCKAKKSEYMVEYFKTHIRKRDITNDIV